MRGEQGSVRAGQEGEMRVLFAERALQGFTRPEGALARRLGTTRVVIVEHAGSARRAEARLNCEVAVIRGVDRKAELRFPTRGLACFQFQRALGEPLVVWQVHAFE